VSTAAERNRRAEPAATLSGVCRQARAEAKHGHPKAAAQFHANCRGRWFARPGEPATVCVCPCHRPTQPDLAAQLDAARRARQEAVGIDFSVPAPKVPRSACRNGHEMTPENTALKGDCRKCKQINSAKSKKRKKEQARDE